MKKFHLLTALILALCLVWGIASAAPRYPTQQGSVTDAAAVLASDTVSDLKEVAKELKDETGASLYVATVDFLDGMTISAYGEGLRDQWNLGSSDALLLLSVGEDQFALFGGKDFNKKVASATQQKLLTTYLQEPFLAQDYDRALRAFIPALITECAKSWDEDIDIGGLLGSPETTAVPLNAQDWFVRRVEQRTETESIHRVTDEDEDTGISLGKIILTIFLLTIIFGKKDRRHHRHDRRGCGCGCMPFSSLLAALGLWKLWDRD